MFPPLVICFIVATSNALSLTHQDIRWKLRPPPDTPVWQKIRIATTGWAIRTLTPNPPTLLFPKTPTVVLEAWDRRQGNVQLGRFGITVDAGPSTPELVDTVSRTTGQDYPAVAAAAIIYMFVEPEHRGKDIGALALEVIAYLHGAKGCGCTILVADDKSEEQKLVKWYECHGYQRAPGLQEMMGSPNEIYGVAMIAPSSVDLPSFEVEWW